MVEKEGWTPFSWYCPNCGTMVTGYKNKEGCMKAECKRCKAVMVRTLKGAKHNHIDIFVSDWQSQERQGSA